eukprot:3037740-Amphidinium_carterae.1
MASNHRQLAARVQRALKRLIPSNSWEGVDLHQRDALHFRAVILLLQDLEAFAAPGCKLPQ